MNRQCQIVLARLKRGPATSWELQQLGVCSHTARIADLRNKHRYEIIRSEKRVRGRRIVTYTLVGQQELFNELQVKPSLLNAQRSNEASSKQLE